MSLDTDFSELIERIRRGRELDHASFEPIYYLVFSPKEILNVKRQMTAWLARLRNEGWQPTVFSMAENIGQILKEAPPRRFWLTADRNAPFNWKRTNDALANALNRGALQKRLEEQLAVLQSIPNALLVITDLEALHPYMRIGAIESQLYGNFTVPTVFLYPGERTGKTRLKFMGFYPEDGNYRSVHVGGN